MDKDTEKHCTQYGICVTEDYFLEDKTIWVAYLSNGVVAYQDDDRDGQKEPVAWKRLADYCNSENINISSLHIKFRSNIIHITLPNSKGHYFSYGILKDMHKHEDEKYYVCGNLLDEGLQYTWYKTPELTLKHTTKREPEDSDFSDQKLILNDK
tara:strand:- start:32 stop:493 length:462 start_codon:yes stop_codon:yes gene_type:complete